MDEAHEFLKENTHIFSSSKTSNFSLNFTASICSVEGPGIAVTQPFYSLNFLSSSNLALSLFANISGKSVSVLFDTTVRIETRKYMTVIS